MKLRQRTSRRKWRNRFYRLQKAACIEFVQDEALASPMGDVLARAKVNAGLDLWLLINSIGEVGEREIEVSRDAFSVGSSLWHTHHVAYRASVMAKRPFWVTKR